MKHLPLTLAFASVLLAACSPATTNDQGSSSSSAGGTVSVSWEFEETRRSEYDQPFSRVTLVLSGDVNEEIDLGEWSGTCGAQQDAELQKEGANALSGIRCWWAGGGEDFLLRRTDPGTLRVEHRSVDEGTAEEPAPVFPYKLVGDEIEIDANTIVRVK